MGTPSVEPSVTFPRVALLLLLREADKKLGNGSSSILRKLSVMLSTRGPESPVMHSCVSGGGYEEGQQGEASQQAAG